MAVARVAPPGVGEDEDVLYAIQVFCSRQASTSTRRLCISLESLLTESPSTLTAKEGVSARPARIAARRGRSEHRHRGLDRAGIAPMGRDIAKSTSRYAREPDYGRSATQRQGRVHATRRTTI